MLTHKEYNNHYSNISVIPSLFRVVLHHLLTFSFDVAQKDATKPQTPFDLLMSTILFYYSLGRTL